MGLAAATDSEDRSAGAFSRGADGQRGLTRSWTRATTQMVADFWRLRSCSVNDPASSSGSCSTQEPALRGGCRGAPLRPRSHPRLRRSQQKRCGDDYGVFSLWIIHKSAPGEKKRKRKKSVRAEGCSCPKCSALRVERKQAFGDGRGLPGSIKFAPNRRDEGWDGVVFLHRLVGKKSLSR